MVDPLRMQQHEQVVHQLPVVGRMLEAELGTHAGRPHLVEVGRESAQGLECELDSLVALLVDERQQCLGQAGQVPLHDLRLRAERVPAAVVDRAEHGGRVVRIR